MKSITTASFAHSSLFVFVVDCDKEIPTELIAQHQIKSFKTERVGLKSYAFLSILAKLSLEQIILVSENESDVEHLSCLASIGVQLFFIDSTHFPAAKTIADLKLISSPIDAGTLKKPLLKLSHSEHQSSRVLRN